MHAIAQPRKLVLANPARPPRLRLPGGRYPDRCSLNPSIASPGHTQLVVVVLLQGIGLAITAIALGVLGDPPAAMGDPPEFDQVPLDMGAGMGVKMLPLGDGRSSSVVRYLHEQSAFLCFALLWVVANSVICTWMGILATDNAELDMLLLWLLHLCVFIVDLNAHTFNYQSHDDQIGLVPGYQPSSDG